MTKTPLDHNGSEVFLYGMHLHLGDHVFINYGADFLGKRENDFTILVGREYDFTESGGTGVISSDCIWRSKKERRPPRKGELCRRRREYQPPEMGIHDAPAGG